MHIFKENKKAVWTIAITISILIFLLGHTLAEWIDGFYDYPEWVIISLIVIVIIMGTAYFITRQDKND